jgi:hypothetical protein
MSVQYSIAPFNSTLTYKKYDVVYGIYIGSTIHSSPYFYATSDVAAGYSPSGVYNYPITQFSRSEDVTTLTYSHTGGPAFGVGSIIKVTGMANTTVNFTGMVMQGGSGTISFVNPGWPETTATSIGAINCLSPAWTTGFMHIPDYTTNVDTENPTIVSQMGGGYSQRISQGINTFNQGINLVFRNIGPQQTKAINNFIQDKQGVYPFDILLNDQFLNNQPNQKYVGSNVKIEPASFKLYNVSVQVNRVFDL